MPRKSKQPVLPEYWRAAKQRLAASKYLLDSEEYRLEAMYLAGYAVECALKAMIVARTPRQRRSKLVEEFLGAVSHRFDHLKDRLARLGCAMPAQITEQLSAVRTWSTSLRYEAGVKSYEDAKAFIDAAQEVLGWAERSR